jgi:hypothetical protein
MNEKEVCELGITLTESIDYRDTAIHTKVWCVNGLQKRAGRFFRDNYSFD